LGASPFIEDLFAAAAQIRELQAVTGIHLPDFMVEGENPFGERRMLLWEHSKGSIVSDL
jgi:phosphatidate phosphatase PAH1